MKVHLLSDGRVFDADGPDGLLAFEPGDVAQFDEDILLVVKVDGDRADAIEHPAAHEMMKAALGSGSFEARMAAYYRIHAQTMARGWLAAREVGLLGGGRANRGDLHVFDCGDENVVAADEDDAIAVMREHYGWTDDFLPEDFERPRRVGDDAALRVTFEPVDFTAGQWCSFHGRGWLSGCI